MRYDFNKEEFHQLHWQQKMPIRKIAKVWNANATHIYKWVEQEKIPIKRGKYKFSNELIYKWYWKDELTMPQIAENLGVNRNCVSNILRGLNIPIRNKSECMKLSWKRGNLIRQRRGKEHPSWKGGRTLGTSGYYMILMPDHHRVSKNGYVYEHIIVWEEFNKKQLKRGWIIHHLNGIKTDNRPQNLVALPNKKHFHVLAAKAKRIQELEALLNNQHQLC